jgi:predicted nucleotide-binding protein
MSITEELFEVANGAAEARASIHKKELQEPLDAIRKVGEEAKRAWCGSNIGYHSTVYYAGLEPSPPDAQFSAEWGMLDRWPTHRPDPGWQVMDRQAVTLQLLARAGQPDLTVIKTNIDHIRATFSGLKERSISLLTAALADKSDTFLDRKLKQIEPLIFDDARTIERRLLPRGQVWSRDSLAMTQGLQVAPHQSLVALGLSATVLENGLDTLENASSEAAKHLQRLEGSHNKRTRTAGNKIFIGHGRSMVWRDLKDFLEARLHLSVDEFNSVSVAGIATTARLSELLDAAEFAFLIMTAEDEQADGKMRTRENVVHEVGLFQGRLGFTRAIILLEEGCQEFSNIHGLGRIQFPKGHISSKFEEIRAVLEREKLIES